MIIGPIIPWLWIVVTHILIFLITVVIVTVISGLGLGCATMLYLWQLVIRPSKKPHKKIREDQERRIGK